MMQVDTSAGYLLSTFFSERKEGKQHYLFIVTKYKHLQFIFLWHGRCSFLSEKAAAYDERRKTMKKFLAVMAVFLFLAVAVSPALAQKGRGMGPGGGPDGGPCTDPYPQRSAFERYQTPA
jgi:hypothetical protein